MAWMTRDCSRATCAAPHRRSPGCLLLRRPAERLSSAPDEATVQSETGFVGGMAAWRGARAGFVWLLTLLALCAGCARLPVVPETVDFSIEGKIGLVEDKQRHAGRFSWRQTGDQYDVLLWGPFGQGGTRLRGHAEHVEITGGGGVPPLSGHPRTVMRQRLGWDLPLAMLPWWLLGQPMPSGGVTSAETDSEGRLIAFRQFGWQVRYEQFRVEEDPRQPSRIVAQRPGYRINLVILGHGCLTACKANLRIPRR